VRAADDRCRDAAMRDPVAEIGKTGYYAEFEDRLRELKEARMAETKTRPTDVSVDAFLDGVAHPVRRADGKALREMMERVTGEPATMWGPSIVGFGSYHYRYASGHEGDSPRVGFSPRSANLVLYVGGFPEYEALLARLGKHKGSKACLYLGKLADVDTQALEEIVRRTYAATEGADHCPVC
jgi:hypothetical protein